MATNYELAFEQRPAVYAAWGQLNGAIKAGMDLRRYELATLAAARRLRSSYCCLAHGTVLAERFGEPVAEIAVNHRAAGLDEIDVAVMDLAEQVVDDAPRSARRTCGGCAILACRRRRSWTWSLPRRPGAFLQDPRRARCPARLQLWRA